VDGTRTLATVTLNSQGVTVFSTSTLSAATHTITARYNGDANYASNTSAALLQTVSSGLQIRTGTVQSAVAATAGGDTSTVATALSGQNGPTDTSSIASERLGALPPSGSPDDAVRDEFFSLVGQGDEKALFGIQSGLSNGIDSLWGILITAAIQE
jgi:hypothetical protein